MRISTIKLFTRSFFAIPLLVLLTAHSLDAQSWERDSRLAMDIPGVMAMVSSDTHLYVLSENEGLIVFRSYEDGLQWLYTSEGMERRGQRLQADIRFAYLFGDSRQLTVVEPTSVLGVYSSTELPARPYSVVRLDNHIYIAMGEDGLGRLSLESPDHLDSSPEILLPDELDNRSVIDLVSDPYARIYLLADDQTLLLIEADSNDDEPEVYRELNLDRTTERLFLTDNELLGSNSDGELFMIDSAGETEVIARLDESIDMVRSYDDHVAIRTVDGILWLGPFGEQPSRWNENGDGGFYFATAGDKLWVSEYNRVAPLVRASGDDRQAADADEAPVLKKIEQVTVPYPRSVIIPLELESNHDPSDIEFSYRSEISNARIRGQTFYWQPSSNQTGRHTFTIAASTSSGVSDSFDMTIDVRPFNAPPRFSTIRPQTVQIEESFTFEISAFDPDGVDQDLIRYIGVDMPDGASLDERTGEFSWTPTVRQTGEHTFQVIATDQFGAANSADVTIRVIETDREEDAELNLEELGD
jgi:hypothetical protein